MEHLQPRDEADIIEIVKAALANQARLEIVGNGTKRGLGRPVIADKLVSTSALSNISMYEAPELVMTAGAGTPLAEIVAALDEHNQELAFEPMDTHLIYGNTPLSGTIGGLVGVNASGPRRIKTGAARDAVLGFRAISGRGELYKSGGRVMKNVTGYDLSKLMTGSYGTLGIMSEITFKVLPKAETEQSVVLTGLDDAAAIALMCEASGLPFEVSSLAHRPKGSCGGSSEHALTVLRLEGPEISVNARAGDLIAHCKTAAAKAGGTVETLEADASRSFWITQRDVAPLAELKTAQIWRLSTAPANGAKVVADILAQNVPARRWIYDWAGGLIWLAVEPAPDAHAPAIRTALKPHGGHATLTRADDDVRGGDALAVAVFQPQPAALAKLSARVKESFDPRHILNPGRLVPVPQPRPASLDAHPSWQEGAAQ